MKILRIVVASVVAAIIAAPVALSQTGDGRFAAGWEERPTARSFELHYPRRALSTGHSGIVALCCTPREDRRLDCRIGSEWPQGMHFGGAAMSIAEDFLMSEASFAEYSATPAAWMQVPIQFRLEPLSSENQDVLRQVSAAMQGVCRPGQAPVG